MEPGRVAGGIETPPRGPSDRAWTGLLLGVGGLLAVLVAGVSLRARTDENAMTPAAIYARSAGGVVDIRVAATRQGPFGPEPVRSEGSGFVLDGRGDVVTAEHVIAGATSIVVRFQTGRAAKANVVAASVGRDLAVIHVRVPGRELHPLPLGTSAGVRPGDPVVAIGSVLGYPRSVTAGIVSGVGRTIRARNGAVTGGILQSDVAIGAGSSGGPLLDERGRVVGVNVQLASGSLGFEGVGLAVPVEALQPLQRRLARAPTQS